MTTVLDRQRRNGARSGGQARRQPKLPRDRREGGGVIRRFLIASSLFLFLMIVTGLIAIWVAWVSTPLPPEVPLAQTSTVSDANGKQLAVFNAGENREPVKIGDVPPVVIQAVIDTEDHSYYKHHGIDPRGISRALYVDIRSGSSVQGGSTITQQYVKQVYVGSDRTLWRKFREAILAVKLDQRESKDQVLERYLNTIYFGRGAYGVQTASHAYFNKDVKQLQLQEAAYLAGLIRGPELADAYKHPETAQDRRSKTLSSMVRYGAISPQQEAEVNATPLKKYVVEKAPITAISSSSAKGADYFVDYVKTLLIKKYGEQLVQTGGLKVKTTLDASLQTQAYNSVYGFLKPSEPAGALVSLDQNGYIKAMVGGRDHTQSEVNLAIGKDGAGSGRQAGSTFKAFELASAIENGACYKDTYKGSPSLVLPGWDPSNSSKAVTNFGGESFGNIDLVEATVHSVNTVYAQLVMEYGASSLVAMAQKAGITSQLDASHNSIVLGVDPVSPLEMADAYLTFSQGGVRVTPNPILEVKNADGQTLEKASPKRERVMDAKTAAVVNYALQQVVQRGTGTAARSGVNGNIALAGKTGTTEDSADAWFVGYTPTMSTAVWMGYSEGSSHKMSNVRGIQVTGGSFPAQMFSSYMHVATAKDKGSTFAGPESCTSKKNVIETTTLTSSSSTIPAGLTTTTPRLGLEDLNRQADGRPGRGRLGTTTTVLDPNIAIDTIDPTNSG